MDFLFKNTVQIFEREHLKQSEMPKCNFVI